MPWASGKRRPPPKKQPWVKRVKKSASKTLRKYPLLGVVAKIGFAVAAIALLVTGLLLENLLFFLASALSGLGALAVRRAVQLEKERQQRGPKVTMPPPSSRPREPTPKPGAASASPPANGPVLCTESKKPIDGVGKCDCASRHVATEEGARRYGRPVGTPLGRKSKQKASGTARTGG